MESKNLLNSYKAYIVSEYNNSGEFIKYCVTIKELNISFNLYFKGEASLEFLNKQIKSNLINYLQGKEIEDLLGERVNLRLWVKVQHNWRSDPSFLKQIGYDKKELS